MHVHQSFDFSPVIWKTVHKEEELYGDYAKKTSAIAAMFVK